MSEPNYWMWAPQHDFPESLEPLTWETGRDGSDGGGRKLALMRVKVWRRRGVTSRLLRRPVYLGEWETTDD